MGRVHQSDLAHAPHVGATLADLAAWPVVEQHPLARFLFDRGIKLTNAARMLGCSRWTLRDWLSFRSRPVWWRAREIARALGFEDEWALFPPA